MKRIISAITAIIIVLAIPFAGALAEGENLVRNGDFEKLGAENLPAGWEFSAYIADGSTSRAAVDTDSERGQVLVLTSIAANDAHFVQTVTVKPDSVYKLSCYIKTENVQGGAGANIALEDIICRSEPIFGTNAWRYAELIGKTGKDQKQLAVGCRLGGFSADSRGKAWFDDFRMEKLNDYTGETVNFFKAEDSGNNGADKSNNNEPKTHEDYLQERARLKMAIILICVYVLAPLAIVILLKYEGDCDKLRDKPLRKTPAQLEPSFFDTSLIPKKTDTKLHYTKKDWLFVCLLTLVYTALTVSNLGSVSAPENQWEGQTGDTAVITFDRAVTVGRVMQDGGIAENAAYTLTGDDGVNITSEQKYGEMYRWRYIGGSMNSVTEKLILNVTKGKVWINELAFYDTEGNLIKASAGDEASAALVDEQNTIPPYPSYMNGMYFDELYHARTAYEHLHSLKVYEVSHPPLGKIIISIGIAVFGMNPFGWRVMGALFGAAMIPVMYAFGKRLFKRSELALLAAFLLAFDFMHFTQTRISTIDTYGVFFNLCMTYYMYKFIKTDLGDSFKESLKPLALSGLFFGIGCASKWICIYTGGALAVMFFAKMIVMWVKAAKINKAELALEQLTEPAVINAKSYPLRFIKTCLCCIVFFVIIPVTIYMASYYPYWKAEWKQQAIEKKIDEMYLSGELTEESEIPENPLEIADAAKAYIKGVLDNQKYMYDYHSQLKTPHAYQSAWYEWPLGDRPIWFYSGGYHPDRSLYGTILSFGNPAVWWICFIGTVTFIIMLICGKFKLNTEAVFILACTASSMLPWMLITRSVFIYHYFATVPMIILASVYVFKHYEDKYYYQPLEDGMMLSKAAKRLSKVKWVWMAFALALFIIFYPVLTGTPVKTWYIDALQWLPTWTFRGFWH